MRKREEHHRVPATNSSRINRSVAAGMSTNAVSARTHSNVETEEVMSPFRDNVRAKKEREWHQL